jgi:hypothetical protein
MRCPFIHRQQERPEGKGHQGVLCSRALYAGEGSRRDDESSRQRWNGMEGNEPAQPRRPHGATLPRLERSEKTGTEKDGNLPVNTRSAGRGERGNGRPRERKEGRTDDASRRKLTVLRKRRSRGGAHGDARACGSIHSRTGHQPPEGRERETGRRVVAPLRHPGAAGGETHTTIELAPIRPYL